MLNIHKLKKNNINKNITFKSGDLIEESKHYPSSSKEWFTSVYSYNKNNQKSLPSINITVSNIIKSYFNMYSIKLETSILARRVARWKRRLKLDRILMGKPEFKHTNDKVIITLYTYNRELIVLNNKVKNLKQNIYIEYFQKLIIKNKLILNNINVIKSIVKQVNIVKKQLKKIVKLKKKITKSYLKSITLIINKYKTLKKFKNNKSKIYLAKSLNYIEKKIEKKNEKSIWWSLESTRWLLNKMESNKVNVTSDNISSILNITSKFNISRLMYLDILNKLIINSRLYLRYNRIIFFNKSKFNIHLMPLKIFLEKIYKKEVEFNIVNLRNYHLDSTILTQVMAIKLRNRKNIIGRVIGHVLGKIKLPLTRRLAYQKLSPKTKLLQNLLIKNLIKNNSYNIVPALKQESINKKSGIELKQLSVIESKGDKLDAILKVLYPIEYTITKSNLLYILKRNLKNTTLDNMKNKLVSGIRIEASGRLSKRIIASKAIYKVSQKGTIRNIDSSYKKLSTTLLRGNFKSNVQFTIANSKTRIGAFGIKGWISSI